MGCLRLCVGTRFLQGTSSRGLQLVFFGRAVLQSLLSRILVPVAGCPGEQDWRILLACEVCKLEGERVKGANCVAVQAGGAGEGGGDP